MIIPCSIRGYIRREREQFASGQSLFVIGALAGG
jgi:hypothetical protein